MDLVDLAFTPALQQAELVRRQEISPLELVELYLERIQQLDGALGSYVTVAAEQAIADARTKTEALRHTPVDELPPFLGYPLPLKT